MPNPLMRSGMMNQSKGVSSDRMPLQPTPDEIAVTVFPYRGVENHGVEVEEESLELSEHDWTDDSFDDYEDTETPVEPIPVRIVQGTSARTFKDFRTERTPVYRVGVKQLAGRDRARTVLTLWAPEDIYVSSDPGFARMLGYVLTAGTRLELHTTEPVYATTVSANDTVVYTLKEFETVIHD